jgi:hypothetical protein
MDDFFTEITGPQSFGSRGGTTASRFTGGPVGISQYAYIVRFDKEPDKAGWDFFARPNHISKDQKLKACLGTFRLSVIVDCDGAKPGRKEINVDYRGSWNPPNHTMLNRSDAESCWGTRDGYGSIPKATKIAYRRGGSLGTLA